MLQNASPPNTPKSFVVVIQTSAVCNFPQHLLNKDSDSPGMCPQRNQRAVRGGVGGFDWGDTGVGLLSGLEVAGVSDVEDARRQCWAGEGGGKREKVDFESFPATDWTLRASLRPR